MNLQLWFFRYGVMKANLIFLSLICWKIDCLHENILLRSFSVLFCCMYSILESKYNFSPQMTSRIINYLFH